MTLPTNVQAALDHWIKPWKKTLAWRTNEMKHRIVIKYPLSVDQYTESTDMSWVVGNISPSEVYGSLINSMPDGALNGIDIEIEDISYDNHHDGDEQLGAQIVYNVPLVGTLEALRAMFTHNVFWNDADQGHYMERAKVVTSNQKTAWQINDVPTKMPEGDFDGRTSVVDKLSRIHYLEISNRGMDLEDDSVFESANYTLSRLKDGMGTFSTYLDMEDNITHTHQPAVKASMDKVAWNVTEEQELPTLMNRAIMQHETVGAAVLAVIKAMKAADRSKAHLMMGAVQRATQFVNGDWLMSDEEAINDLSYEHQSELKDNITHILMLTKQAWQVKPPVQRDAIFIYEMRISVGENPNDFGNEVTFETVQGALKATIEERALEGIHISSEGFGYNGFTSTTDGAVRIVHMQFRLKLEGSDEAWEVFDTFNDETKLVTMRSDVLSWQISPEEAPTYRIILDYWLNFGEAGVPISVAETLEGEHIIEFFLMDILPVDMPDVEIQTSQVENVGAVTDSEIQAKIPIVGTKAELWEIIQSCMWIKSDEEEAILESAVPYGQEGGEGTEPLTSLTWHVSPDQEPVTDNITERTVIHEQYIIEAVNSLGSYRAEAIHPVPKGVVNDSSTLEYDFDNMEGSYYFTKMVDHVSGEIDSYNIFFVHDQGSVEHIVEGVDTQHLLTQI